MRLIGNPEAWATWRAMASACLIARVRVPPACSVSARGRMAAAMKTIIGPALPNGIAVLALALLSVCAAPRAWPLDGGRIVFGGQTADLALSVYVTAPKGAGFEELTAHGPDAYDPTWSHDGRAIAFSYSPQGLAYRIYLMDADGGNLRRISDAPAPYGDKGPTWSPRDDAVAFTSYRDGAGRQGVYVANVIGGEDVRLSDPDAFAWEPSWRSSGNAIAYSGNREGFIDPDLDLHIMDRQGRHLSQLTDGAPALNPDWHPRRNTIAFESWDDDHDADIYTTEADGSDERRLTKHPSFDSEPRWSPDGTELLFESTRDGPPALFVMGLDGRIRRRVTAARFIHIDGADWFDPDFPRSVSTLGRHATTWGWIRHLGTRRR